MMAVLENMDADADADAEEGPSSDVYRLIDTGEGEENDHSEPLRRLLRWTHIQNGSRGSILQKSGEAALAN